MPRAPRPLIAAGLAAAIAPCLAWGYLEHRQDSGLEPALSRALRAKVDVAAIEVGVTGQVELRGIRVARMLHVDRVEVAVSLGDLADGAARVDEVRVASPRIRVELSDLADPERRARLRALVRRLRGRGSPVPPAPHAAGSPVPALPHSARPVDPSRWPAGPTAAQHRRPAIAVHGGDLVVDLGAAGQVRVRDLAVTSTPDRAGVRVAAGRVAFDLARGGVVARGHFSRVAADLRGLRLDRFLAVGGAVELGQGDELDGSPGPGRGRARPRSLTLAPLSARYGLDRPGAGRLTVEAGSSGDGPDHPRVTASLARQATGPALILTASELPLAVLGPLAPRSVDLSVARGSGRLALDPVPLAGLLGETSGSRDPARGWSIAADVDLDGVRIDDRRIARPPVTGAGSVELRARVARRDGSRHIALESLRLVTGELAVEVDGEVSLAGADGARSWMPDRVALRARVPAVECADALASLPASLRPALAGLDLSGGFAATAGLRFDRADPAATELDLAVDVTGCRVAREAVAGDPTSLVAPWRQVFPDGSARRVGHGAPGYASLASLPGHVPAAFVAAEDARFYDHRGFDVRQIERSLAVDLHEGAFVRGGSTISQQLVKNVFLSHDRNLSRKLQEAVLTWRLEAHLSKRQILERYLNIVELGPGVFGVERAARYWFGKSARELGVKESAFLAALTPAPHSSSRRIAARGGIDDAMARRVDAVLRNMRDSGLLSGPRYRRASALPLRLDPATLTARTARARGRVAER